MAATSKRILDDLGSLGLREVANLLRASRAHSTPVLTGSVADTQTGTVYPLGGGFTEDVLIYDIMYSNLTAHDIADVDTDIIADWDNDLSFATPLGVAASLEGFNAAGNNLLQSSMVSLFQQAADAVSRLVPPFILPAGSLLRVRLINNENAQALEAAVHVVYRPMNDEVILQPDLAVRHINEVTLAS